MSENTFEYKDKRYRFSMEGDHVVVIELHHDGKWWPQCQVVGLARPGIIALLRECTARADVFARLMEDIKATCYYDPERLDALQAEWDNPAQGERSGDVSDSNFIHEWTDDSGYRIRFKAFAGGLRVELFGDESRWSQVPFITRPMAEQLLVAFDKLGAAK